MATNGIYASALRSAIDGEVFGSTDPGFEAACLGFNLAHEFRPDIAVLPRSSRDVAAAVRHAADHGLAVHVQATGHGLGTQAHGGMLINTAGLQELDLDPEARSVRVGAGVRWSKVIAAAAPHGLAPLNGSSPDIGVVGYTMGGGMGPMGRTFGFAADHVTALRMVTASGDTLEVDAVREPELFWALRGGKCSVGIVTQLRFGVHPVAEVYGAASSLPGSTHRSSFTPSARGHGPCPSPRPPPWPCCGCPTPRSSPNRCAARPRCTCAMSTWAATSRARRCSPPCAAPPVRWSTWWR
ncbi:MAG: FAD-binding oxidoreductase [Paeniglutamicibacter sp.]